MNKSLKRLKKLIIIIMAVILLIIISLLILLNANKNNVQNRNVLQLNEEEFVEDIDYEPDTNIKKVTDRIQYYRIKDIIDRYCEQMNIINTLSQADLDAESKEKMISVIIDMLSNEYITQFSITSDTILNEANKYQESNYIINSMYKLELSQNIKVFIVQLEMNTDTNTNFLIAVDYNNNTFKIYGNDYVRKYNYDKDMGKLNDLNIESI